MALGSLKFWEVTILENAIDAYFVGLGINYAHEYPVEVSESLSHIIDKKMYYFKGHDTQHWSQALKTVVIFSIVLFSFTLSFTMGQATPSSRRKSF